MATKDEEFLKKLLAAFRIEAEEHIRAIANGLLQLEKRPGGSVSDETIEVMYREAHSLKGAARSVNKTDIESVCQAVESVFSALKSGRFAPYTELFDSLHRAVDAMAALLAESEGVEIQSVIHELAGLERGSATERPVRRKKPVPPPEPSPTIDEPSEVREAKPIQPDREEVTTVTGVRPEGPIVRETPVRESPVRDPLERPATETVKERHVQAETVRIAIDKLDPLLRQVSEMVSVKLTARQRVSDLVGLVSIIDQWKQRWASVSSHEKSFGATLVRKRGAAETGRSDAHIAKIMDFLDWNHSCIKSMEDKLKGLIKLADGDARLHGSMVDDLLEDMMNVLMLPCSSLLEIFPKLVRDLARDSGKEIDLVVYGADLEIDRRILEEMKDPLIHLVRNCVDHGIEKPEERLRDRKPREGTITISFSQISGNQIELAVSDDGAGIDVSKVREVAARRGMLTEQEKYGLDPQEAISLVFRSDVSTSPIVSNLSGRGLGLAIVREKVENLGGSIAVATAPQMGTSFRILLPVTLSTFRGILVRAADQLFVVPTANVERVARIKKDIIKTVGNRETIEVNGRAIPLVRLAEVLELPRSERRVEDSGFLPVLLLSAADKRVAFSVDVILQEQEVLVKGLGKQLSRVRNVAGATVLGSGKLAPILNVSDLIKSAIKGTFHGAGVAARVEQIESHTKSVLVVEDSITSRMLLKNILESAGYQVTTSVDGADAWTALKTDRFDLVVSDIEMPRMNGFELTTNIRGDDRLSELPVVLVTSLGSREDRERGIDVGANAYIVKGSFDQNNLLQIVERLV